jgi:hypothetical protein
VAKVRRSSFFPPAIWIRSSCLRQVCRARFLALSKLSPALSLRLRRAWATLTKEMPTRSPTGREFAVLKLT